ncbi:M48 family metallopeptidase [Inediibacterium massiliense]|uniref:M48 family metallopeptidase n=1 Tax=Inediibacterium massiliense TaxID=1658111 RepID=UPI0006B58E90|nr:SprT family zinc-dependent metalloprotease [Inediibacterium massiliense]
MIYKEFEFSHIVKKSDRKTFEIRIEPPDLVILKAPKKAKEEDIIKILKRKEKWIRNKLQLLKKINCLQKQYINGENFLYLGKNYLLKIIINSTVKNSTVEGIDQNLVVTMKENDQQALKDIVINWYAQKALEKIVERVNDFQKYFEVKPNKITIKNQKTRWGSCSSKRNLNFNFRIIIAPIEIIDYLVVHEMCHLIHMDHSKNFWGLVESIIPDYKKRREWLKVHGIELIL